MPKATHKHKHALLIQFINSKFNTEEYEEVYDIVTDHLHLLQTLGESCEIQDIYTDGANFYLAKYHTTYVINEGHGFHYDYTHTPVGYTVMLTEDEVLSRMYPEFSTI